MKVQLPDLFGNYDRPTEKVTDQSAYKPADQPTNRRRNNLPINHWTDMRTHREDTLPTIPKMSFCFSIVFLKLIFMLLSTLQYLLDFSVKTCFKISNAILWTVIKPS